MNKIKLFPLIAAPLAMTVMPTIQAQDNQEKPNIVWFLTEDLSPDYLRLFNNNESGAFTPNVKSLADEGITFTHAYSNAPVSSASRTTLITGCYAPKFAGSFHRKIEPIPYDFKMFPTYLREAGYYTSNCVKTDYNVVYDDNAWDNITSTIGDWRNRKDKNQPFFFMRSNMLTHESKLHFPKEDMVNKPTIYNPASTKIHPYLPNTPLMRYTYARIYDRIGDSDRELGEIIRLLKEDKVMDNTFIFYFGDNGGTLPGTKGYTNDLGFHVPLVVYVPTKWRDKVGIPVHSIHNGFVSFMDFGPTLLHLAGIKVPKYMDGKPFLGKDVEHSKKEILGYGDRFDEFYAFNRTIYQGKYRYARNYKPYHSKSLYALYRYKMEAFKEWKDLYEEGKLNKLQSTFFKPQGAEELYDLQADPYEQHNLAADPAYKSVVEDMRTELRQQITEKNDLGFIPETVFREEGFDNLVAYGKKSHDRIVNFALMADNEMKNFTDAQSDIKKGLHSRDEVERWWAMAVCASFGNEAQPLKRDIEKQLKTKRSYLRSQAMVALSYLGERFSSADVYSVLSNCKTDAETLLVLNDLTHMVEQSLITPFPLDKSKLVHYEYFGIDWRMQYLNECYDHRN